MSYGQMQRSVKEQLVDIMICLVRGLYYWLADPIGLYFARKSWGSVRTPLVSILIPTRNRDQLLWERAVNSVLKQTYKDWELIIVFDGYKSKVLEFIHLSSLELIQFVKPTPDYKIRTFEIKKDFHYPKNAWARWCAGPVRALNFGYTKVKGDYILRMDDDDELKPNAIKDLLIAINNEDEVEYISAALFARGQETRPYKIGDKLFGGIQTGLMRSYLRCFRYNPACWRKRWNCMNEIDLQDRMVRAGVKTAYLNEVVCKIDPRPGQTEVGWKAQQKQYKDSKTI